MDFSYISSILIPLETGGVEFFFLLFSSPSAQGLVKLYFTSYLIIQLQWSRRQREVGFLYYRSHHFLSDWGVVNNLLKCHICVAAMLPTT